MRWATPPFTYFAFAFACESLRFFDPARLVQENDMSDISGRSKSPTDMIHIRTCNHRPSSGWTLFRLGLRQHHFPCAAKSTPF